MTNHNLTQEEIDTFKSANRLSPAIWRIVAKDNGCEWEDYKHLPHRARWRGLVATFKRIEEVGQ